VLWRRAKRRGPLVLLLHGHGVDEHDIFPLERNFPAAAGVAALRGPIASEGGYRWYAHYAVGRPIASSLAGGMAYVDAWLAGQEAAGLWLVGFSGGALMAGALLLASPHRFAGVAMLHGPLPFDAGVPIEPGRLAGCEVYYGYGEQDAVVPPALTARSRAYLGEESGAHAEIRGYRAAHALVPAEERDLARWFAALT
jgi:phospholipase/carboxylesterase